MGTPSPTSRPLSAAKFQFWRQRHWGWRICEPLHRMVQTRPRLQENVGSPDEHIGTPPEKNREQNHTSHPMSSKWRPRGINRGLGTDPSSCVGDMWGDSSIRYFSWEHPVLHKCSTKQEGRHGGGPGNEDVQGVRVFMFFPWVYGFPLGVWFSFGFMVLVCVNIWVFPLDVWYSYVLSGLGICYSYVLSGLGI